MIDQTVPVTVRASSSPLVVTCPQSRLGAMHIDVANDAAAVGTAVHELMPMFIRGDRYDDVIAQAEIVAGRHGVADSAAEVAQLAGMAYQLWKGIEAKHPQPITERTFSVDLDGIVLTGHPDVVSPQASEVRVVDWKTGRKRDPLLWVQLCAYGLLVADAFNKDRVRITIVWVRDGERETHTIDKLHIDHFRDDLIRAVRTDRRYVVGDHCVYCPRMAECPARKELCKAAAESANAADCGGDIRRQPVDKVLAGMRAFERLAGTYKDMIKQSVTRYGPIEVEGARLIGLKPRTRSKLVNPKAAYPIVQQYITPDQWASVFESGLTALKDAVRANAKRGEKSQVVSEVLDKLDAAGCIEVKSHDVIAEVDE